MMIEAFGYVWLQWGLREWKIGEEKWERKCNFSLFDRSEKVKKRKRNGKNFPTEPTIFFLSTT